MSIEPINLDAFWEGLRMLFTMPAIQMILIAVVVAAMISGLRRSR